MMSRQQYVSEGSLLQLQMCRKIIKRIIEIAQYGCNEQLLQSHIPALNIKSPPQNLKADVQKLKLAAAQNQVLSLSSNQIRMQHRMFAILKAPRIIPGKWISYENVEPNDYRVIINPTLLGESSLRLKDFQECPSIPGLRFHIWNPISSRYKFLLPKVVKERLYFQQKQEQLKGFESRVWDHEMRHLEGILALDPTISNSQVSVAEDYQQIPAMHELVLNLKAQLKLTSDKNVMKMMRKKKQEDQQQAGPESIPDKITKEMKGRMNRHYQEIKKQLQQEQKKAK